MTSDNPSVDILLACYNGEKYLHEQLDSLLAQALCSYRILARDDGSADRTPEILAEYAAKWPEKLRVLSDGKPSGGAKGNFRILLRHSTSPYIAFCDQDDVWKPFKLTNTLERVRQLEAEHGEAQPVLVFTDLELIDESSQELGRTFWRHQQINPSTCRSLGRLLRQNVVTGCTAMINRALATLGMEIPDAAYMHDWWLALLACCFGSIDYLEQPTVRYRIHGQNVCGLGEINRGLPHLSQSQGRFAEWDRSLQQAQALRATFGERLAVRDRRLVDALLRTKLQDQAWRRVYPVLRYQVFHSELRRNLATLWHLVAEQRRQS